jgi:hypothetical protein
MRLGRHMMRRMVAGASGPGAARRARPADARCRRRTLRGGCRPPLRHRRGARSGRPWGDGASPARRPRPGPDSRSRSRGHGLLPGGAMPSRGRRAARRLALSTDAGRVRRRISGRSPAPRHPRGSGAAATAPRGLIGHGSAWSIRAARARPAEPLSPVVGRAEPRTPGSAPHSPRETPMTTTLLPVRQTMARLAFAAA